MEDKELQVGWAEVPIHEINSYTSNTIDPQAEPDQVFELYSVPAFPTGLPELTKGSEIGSAKQRVKNGDVLICKINPRINRVWIVGKNDVIPQIASSEWIVVRSPHLSASYLCRLFSSPRFRKLLCEGVTGVGGSLTRAQPKRVREFKIPLAPASEQCHIASKLDTTLADVDACRQRLDGVAAILKRFRQAVLAAAAAGELTREWREERGLGHDHFKQCKLKDLVLEPLRNGKSVRDGEGESVLRLSCLKNASIDWKESKRGDWAGITFDRFIVSQGDFLVARGNGSKDLVGRGCLVDEPPPRMAFPDTMIRVRPDPDKIHPFYLAIVWEHRSTRDQIESAARTSAGIWKVAQGDLEVIRLPIPGSNAEQVEIVRRTHELFSLANQLEAKLNTARKVVDRLTPALLAKAFRGELVPQDPSEEPASVLLERIRAARQAEATAGKPSRRGRRKAVAHPKEAPLPAAPALPDLLAQLLQKCGALSKRELLAASGLETGLFQRQLAMEMEAGIVRTERQGDQQVLMVAGIL
jgi:type I restriction enzyme S subunit